SPGKILSIKIPTFEALSQFGTATITTKNIGELEASYSLTVCLLNLNPWASIVSLSKWCKLHGENFFSCAAILKGSDFSVLDQAECQFTTTATVLENGSQVFLVLEVYLIFTYLSLKISIF
ncbi:hypothetical protein GW17_00018366, partial [Ensete ventricosum]